LLPSPRGGNFLRFFAKDLCMRFALAAAFVFALAACGEGGPPPEATSTTPTPSPAEMQAKVAQLPAPYNQASYESGREVFAQCRTCHTIESGGINMVGPNLHGVIGRHIASAAGYNYSPALKAQNFTWDADHLDKWLQGPMTDVPGTRMSFPGIRNDTQRRDVIAYVMVESQQP
jgi:cytochrome c